MSPKKRKENTPDSDTCASYLKALADPNRLQIVRALQSGPLSVTNLAILLESEVSNVSHHLRVLYHAQIVTTERDGKYIYYHLNRELLSGQALRKSLDFGCCKIDLRD